MSTWTNGRRQYGPHCKGTASQHHGSASWDLRFLQFIRDEVPGPGGGGAKHPLRGSHIELAASGMYEVDESAAQAACDEQVAAWQAEFPWEIVTHE